MIKSGEKKEEYREIKPYWSKRFLGHKAMLNPFSFVLIRNGYSSDSPTILIQCKGISIGNAKPEWSDNWQGEVFVIKLGDIIKEGSYMDFLINSQV